MKKYKKRYVTTEKLIERYMKKAKILKMPSYEYEYDITPSISNIIPECCQNCPNYWLNGGSGICNCTLPYFKNPTIYGSSSDTVTYNTYESRGVTYSDQTKSNN